MNDNDNNQPTLFDLYKIALDTRNKEIDLFWQRSNYFLILNTAVATGFFVNVNDNGEEMYQSLISFLGLVVSFLWYRINLGSKFWQSRWEQRLSIMEKKLNRKLKDELKGKIDYKINYFAASRKTINSDAKKHLIYSNDNEGQRWIDSCVLKKPSVSRTMMWLSIVFIFFWFILLIISLWPYIISALHHIGLTSYRLQ